MRQATVSGNADAVAPVSPLQRGSATGAYPIGALTP